MNFAQIKAIEKANKERILKVCPEATEESGIYIFYRYESSFKFGYVGQAKHILTRLAQHLAGYKTRNPQHIDLSLKKHGLYNLENPTGYKLRVITCECEQLDNKEQEYIEKYANAGFQMRNKTSGSQGVGKFGIADNKPAKGYRDGLAQGYKNAQNELKPLFDKYLTVTFDSNKKLAVRAYEKLQAFMGVQNDS